MCIIGKEEEVGIGVTNRSPFIALYQLAYCSLLYHSAVYSVKNVVVFASFLVSFQRM